MFTFNKTIPHQEALLKFWLTINLLESLIHFFFFLIFSASHLIIHFECLKTQNKNKQTNKKRRSWQPLLKETINRSSLIKKCFHTALQLFTVFLEHMTRKKKDHFSWMIKSKQLVDQMNSPEIDNSFIHQITKNS